MHGLMCSSQAELAAVREEAQLWEARANAAAEALHALEQHTDERDRIAHEKMRQAFSEMHEKDMEVQISGIVLVG